MIIVKIMGGLGNQMFQYAFARSLECEKRKKVVIDVSYYDDVPEGDTVRKEFVTALFPHFRIVKNRELKWIKRFDSSFAARVLRRIGMMGKTFWQEGEWHRWPNKKGCIITYFSGYWQSENFFENVKGELRKEFVFPLNELSEQGKMWLDRIVTTPMAVALHVRAGDYLNDENVKYFGNICTAEYYRKACEYMMEYNKDCSFFIFTNDLEWTKRNITLEGFRVEFVEAWDEKQEWEDMFLMSKCAHNIIANSSYSWWGAWLNNNVNKLVISPAKWSNSSGNNNTICKDWVRIG